jgi:quinol monooxygenase YgiN
MWIRQGSFPIVPGKLAELRALYAGECVPVVRAAAGNVDCYLMESVEDPERCIVCTIWRTEADAKTYEATGTAAAIVAKVRQFFAGPPLLTSYRVERAETAS